MPERDDFFEVGRHPPVSGRGGGEARRATTRTSSPGIDDTQLPGSAITTDVNIAQVRITGLEAVLEVHPVGPVAGFVNMALNHAYGYGAVTGAFLADDATGGAVRPRPRPAAVERRGADLFGHAGAARCHRDLRQRADQRRHAERAGRRRLRSDPAGHAGARDRACSTSTRRSRSIPASSSTCRRATASAAGGWSVRPQLFVDNVFNKHYVLKGAFFSGAVVRAAANVQPAADAGDVT